MERASILHMFTPAANLSPFDVNMAIDAGWQHCIPYTALGVADIPAMTQDAIFSRGPKGVKRTGIFVGGRDIHSAMDMLRSARKSMVPPFEVSVFADPSGAFTTAAGMVACAEKQLQTVAGESLAGRRILVFGGTGPVGMTCGMLAARAGADVALLSHESQAKAVEVAEQCRERYGHAMQGLDGSNDALIREHIANADVVFSAAKAGVQVLNKSHLQAAASLKVACDVNAVPPEGIEGLGVMDSGEPLAGAPDGAVGIGALAVGNVKYKTQQALLQQMLSTEKPVDLHFEQAFEVAREQA